MSDAKMLERARKVLKKLEGWALVGRDEEAECIAEFGRSVRREALEESAKERAALRKVAETANVLVYRLVDVGDWWYKSELDPVRAALKELEEERRG